jgi:uncharacterized damage-inducible protein DinB
MDARLEPLASIFLLNTDLVLNCIEDMSEDIASRRADGSANSASYLVAHLTDTRHFLAAWLGNPLENPLAVELRDARGIDDVQQLPSLDVLRAHWMAVSDHLIEAMESAPPEFLNESSPQRFPVGNSRLDALAFLAQHESYHVGQLGWIRRRSGMPAMKYARRT